MDDSQYVNNAYMKLEAMNGWESEMKALDTAHKTDEDELVATTGLCDEDRLCSDDDDDDSTLQKELSAEDDLDLTVGDLPIITVTEHEQVRMDT